MRVSSILRCRLRLLNIAQTAMRISSVLWCQTTLICSDLPFCRTRFLQHGMDWPFGDVAYADMMQIVDRFDTNEQRDLVGVYDALVGEETCDPFEDSAAAVDAFEAADWLPLLEHNLADIQRTRELAELAGRFVPKIRFLDEEPQAATSVNHNWRNHNKQRATVCLCQ